MNLQVECVMANRLNEDKNLRMLSDCELAPPGTARRGDPWTTRS